MKTKICVITGSRAEYGLLFWLLKGIKADKDLVLQLIVTGMHLSSNFGLTYKEIEKDFKVDQKIDMKLSSDTNVGISKSMGIAQTRFAKVYNKLKPDIIIVLGDRFEILSATITAMISKIPIAHIHGGELTEGSWDDSIRHSISKMAHLHFTANEEYRARVIQLGEQPNRVFNIGAMCIENIKKLKFLKREEFEKSINFKLNKKNLLVTFHPVTLETNTAKKQFKEILYSLKLLKNTNIIFTKTNSDTNGKIINNMINDYVCRNSKNSIAFSSLGRLRYLSALKYVDAVIGNSSSGIIEAPSFKLATINIGDRQNGRVKASSIIDCLPKKEDITKALKKIYTKDFIKKLRSVNNPHDNGLQSKKIIKIIKKTQLQNILKKNFYNL